MVVVFVFRLLLSVGLLIVFFLMIRRPPRSTQGRSSAASDVYKRQAEGDTGDIEVKLEKGDPDLYEIIVSAGASSTFNSVSYTHLRAHETPEHLVCRLLLEKKNTLKITLYATLHTY